MAESLQQRILDSIKFGSALVAAYDEIIALSKNPIGPVVQVDIDIGQAVDAIEQVAGIIQGGSIAAVVPKPLLPSGPIAVQSVSFTLFTQTKAIGEISSLIVFGQNGQGVSWNITTIGTAQLTISLDSLLLKWVTPGTPAQFIAGTASGSTTLGDLTLDVVVTYPDATIAFTQSSSDYVNLGDFFQQLGLPPVAFLQQLLLEDFELTYSFAQSQTSLSSRVAANGDTGVTLIPASSGPAILAFEEMNFSFNSAGGQVAASINGQLLVLGALALGVQANRNGDGSWSFTGDIDVPQTWANLHPGASPPPGSLTVSIADFVHIFLGDGFNPPSALPTVSIAELSVDYAYTKAGGDTYALNGVFDANWQLGVDLAAEITVALGTAGNSVSAAFDLEGVAFTLTYAFSKDSSQIDAAIVAGDILSMSGSYTGNTLTLKFQKCPSLATFIAWLVGEVTGNRYFALPDPWDSALSEVAIPSGLEFTINIQQTPGQRSSIACTVPINVSLLGVSLTGFVINYNPPQQGTSGSGLNFGLTTSMGKFNWDPATQQPPTIPGSKAALLDIKLIGAGQHVGFITPPTTVEGAVTALGSALDPKNWTGGMFPAGTMQFSKDIGWLIGTEVVLLGQVDIKFIFNDPTIYGLSLIVSSGNSAALNVLAGLSAEIVYRKVSDTVGVYEGTLTLPSDIRQINLNQVVITLPQFSLSIYTNGDFSFDAGFPYNRDFSQSCSVVAAEYAGAGGFYYAKLDGLDPSELPQIDTNAGVFSPVTEIGIGFEIGVTKGFSAGPLSASCSVMVQGIFQGVFAKYTRYSDNRQDEFFSVDATLAIVGHLIGEINFYIVTASLEVTVYIEVELTLAAYTQAKAKVEVGVDVELTVSINCGLFTIHIHCGYSTTLHTQATFGQNGTGLWASTSLASPRPVLMAAPAPASVGWQPIADTNSLTVYFIPQLTAGLAYPTSDGKTYWYYVGQLALSNPSTGDVNPDPSYASFVKGMLCWALYAFNNQASSTPVPAATANAKMITADDVQQLLDLLKDNTGGMWPQIADIQAQFKSAFQTTVTAMTVQGSSNYGIGFFPAMPGMSVSLQADGNAAVTLVPARLSAARLQAVKSAGPSNAPPTTFLAHLRSGPALSSAAPQSTAEMMMVDFAVMAIRSGLGKIIEQRATIFTQTSMAIGDVLNALQSSLASISGMTTRFMLHGTRQANTDGALEPLYALTGQQAQLTAAELQAANLTMSLAFTSGTPADWGVTFQGGGSSLSLSSADPNPAVFTPKQIPPAPSFSPSDVQSGVMPVADVRPARFYLTTGIADNSGGAGIWRLPQELADHLAQAASNESFAVYYLANASAAPIPANAIFRFTLDFRVRRIPASDGTAGYLANTYELFDVDQGGIQSLQVLVTQIAAGGTPVSALSLVYPATSADSGGKTTSRKAVITPVDFSYTFIVQSNFSTETQPPPSLRAVRATAGAAPADAPAIGLFLTKLWTAGITNSGGYFLFDTTSSGQAPFPDSLFDAGGVATLTLVADLTLSNGANPVALPPYVTGVTTPSYPVGGTGALYVASNQYNAVRAVLPAGHVGVDVSCAASTSAPSGPGTLNQLYNLITAESVTINGTLLPTTGLPPVFGPVNQNGNDVTRWNYRHVFPLVASWPNPAPSTPPAGCNPYTYIGQTAGFGLMWTDLFGNEWGPVASSLSTTLKYLDPLVSLSQLPYLTLDCEFVSVGQAAQLQINLTVALPTYASGDATRQQNDIAAYAQAYYQLTGNQVAATVTTSLVLASGQPAPIPVDVGAISADILKIYSALVAIPLGGTQPPPPLTLDPIAVTVPQANTALKYPLTVALTLTRNGPIADGFPADGPVKTVSTAIAPHTSGQTGDAHSLTDFATKFEAAFAAQDLVIAVGASAGEGLTANSRQVWVVCYGALGINITIASATPANFAPRPLDNVLLSRSAVSVRQLNQDGTLGDDSTAASVAVTDVDLDAQMQKFLAAVDLIFSATDAIPTALVNTSAIDALSVSKQAIVTNLIGYVTDLASGKSYSDGGWGPNDPMTAAAYLYQQQCLIRLSAFYDMNSVTVPMVTATFNGAADPGINLFGHPAQAADSTADGEKEFTLTSGKCALATPTPPATGTPMAIGLFAKNVTFSKQYVGNPSFVVDALQHDITPVTINNETYEVGPWLAFVNPRPDLAMPQLTIPIPLRAFPQPPQLLTQTALELINDPDAPQSTDDNFQLTLAKAWSLNGSYQHAYAAQDTVHLDVKINIGLSGAVALGAMAAPKDLLAALVEFNLIYPQLQALFVSNKLDAIRTPQQAQAAATLKNALQSFATLVGDVATCAWQVTSPLPLLQAAPGEGLLARESQYQIDDGYNVQSPTDIWRSSVALEQDIQKPVGFVPQLQIDGYNTVVDTQFSSGSTFVYKYADPDNPTSFLQAAAAAQIPTRTIAVAPPYSSTPFTPLDIVDRQNGLLSMMIRRNENLPPSFHYETPWVTYTETLSPTFDTSVPIDIAGIGQPNGQPAKRSIAAHLTALFTALVQGSGDQPPLNGSFQVTAYFAYPPNMPTSGTGLSLVAVPIILRLPTAIVFDAPISGTPDYVNAIANAINTWLDANHLSAAARQALWQRSELRFDLSLFSDASQTGRPILRLRSLSIQCVDIV
jgi:hypothetical protein